MSGGLIAHIVCTSSTIVWEIVSHCSSVLQAGGIAYKTLPRGRSSTPRSIAPARSFGDSAAR